ncbi:MAG: hypothetical protein NFW04_02820 [Candidatus Accumulibacter sp.]|uniref:hypothetical protein n=1 Tax=Accumulibacter sp. TaxID=2053492 RepID=UPI0025DD9576|nr:hypothetical protein [Accumulibacter sp.]MCM8597582.1 hypothetical protein [Accumulibacter sp.]
MKKHSGAASILHDVKVYIFALIFFVMAVAVGWALNSYNNGSIGERTYTVLTFTVGVLITIFGMVFQDVLNSHFKRGELEATLLGKIQETNSLITKEETDKFAFYGYFIYFCKSWPTRRYVLIEIKEELGRIKVVGDIASKNANGCLSLPAEHFESKAVDKTKSELWYVYAVNGRHHVIGGAYCNFSETAKGGGCPAQCNASFIDGATGNKVVEAVGIEISQADYMEIRLGKGLGTIRKLDSFVGQSLPREISQPNTICLSNATDAFTGVTNLIKDANTSIWAARFSGGRRLHSLARGYDEWTKNKILGKNCAPVAYKRLITIDTQHKCEEVKEWLEDYGKEKMYQLKRSTWKSYIDFVLVDDKVAAITFQGEARDADIDAVIVTSEPKIVGSVKTIFTKIWELEETTLIKGERALTADEKSALLAGFEREGIDFEQKERGSQNRAKGTGAAKEGSSGVSSEG